MKKLLLILSLAVIFSVSLKAQSEEKLCCSNVKVETTQVIDKTNSTDQSKVNSGTVTNSAGVLVKSGLSNTEDKNDKNQKENKCCDSSVEGKFCCKKEKSDDEKPL